MKTMRVPATVWLILFVGGFLLGFVPEYLKNRDLRSQLEAPQKTIDELRVQLQMSELRDQASLMWVELSRQNYGLARDYAAQYYSKLKDTIDSLQDSALKKSLQELAATRDSVTADLAAANASSLTTPQSIVLKTFEVTRNK
jgi:hypothetical protein